METRFGNLHARKSLKFGRLHWEIMTQAVLNFYQAATVRNASGAATSFGAMMRFTGGTTAVYSGVAPQVASFSARGPDLTTGSLGSTTSTLPVADVLKPNVLAPGEAIWSAWSPLSTTEVASFVGELHATPGQQLFFSHRLEIILPTPKSCRVKELCRKKTKLKSSGWQRFHSEQLFLNHF